MESLSVALWGEIAQLAFKMTKKKMRDSIVECLLKIQELTLCSGGVVADRNKNGEGSENLEWF